MRLLAGRLLALVPVLLGLSILAYTLLALVPGYPPFLQSPLEAVAHLVLPALTLGAALAAATMRMTRGAMLDVLPAEFVRTAEAKGLRRHRVIWRHALVPALGPVVTLVGVQL